MRIPYELLGHGSIFNIKREGPIGIRARILDSFYMMIASLQVVALYNDLDGI